MVERARWRWQRRALMLAASALLSSCCFLAVNTVHAASEAATSDHICTSAEFWALTPQPFGSSPLTIKSLIKGDQVCMEFELSSAVAKDAGWVAVGLSASGNMVSSPHTNVMLFQASAGSLEAYMLNGKSKSAVVKASDQSGYVVSAASISTKTFRYQRTLKAATATDISIDLTTDSIFIWAYGASWPISGHKRGTRGSVTYKFTPEPVTTAPPPEPTIVAPSVTPAKANPDTTTPQPPVSTLAPIDADDDASAATKTPTPKPMATIVGTNETFTVQPTTKKPKVSRDAESNSDRNQGGPILRVTEPFCGDNRNCPAVVGGAAFLFLSVCGLLTTWVLYNTAVGGLLLRHAILGPPLSLSSPSLPPGKSATMKSFVLYPWIPLHQTLADLKVGEAFVVLTFIGAVASLVLLNLNAQESEQVITGQVALLTLMFLLLPVSKVPLWSIFFGSSFERIIKFHRWLGVAMTVAVVVHLIEVLRVTSIFESEQYGEVVPFYGFIALLSFLAMTVLANEYIRRRAFELFYISHRVLAPVGLVFTILHAPKMIGIALIVPLGLYVIGLLIQWILSVTSTFQANISSVQLHQTATLMLRQTKQTEKLALKIRPGSFFWIKLPSVSRTQWHPFSAIVTPNGKSVGFCVKATGERTFTRKLVDEALKKHVVPVSLCGPFGNLSLDVDRYDVVIVIAGGVGITPFVSLINQKRLRTKIPSGKAKKAMTPQQQQQQQEWRVVWSVQSSDHLLMTDDFMPSQQIESSGASDTSSSSIQDPNDPFETGTITVSTSKGVVAATPLNVNWTFHVSTAKSDGSVVRQTGEKLLYKSGRPTLSQVIRISSTGSNGFKSGGHVAVLACGPPAMTAEAQALARMCHFDFHKEVFSW